MANELLILPLHQTQSALGLKVEAKPVSCSHRERSQGRAVMPGHEVASLPSWTGLPLGRSQRRASPFLAKSVLSGQFQTGRGVAHAVSDALMALVLQAVMSDNANTHPTDEVPRCPWRSLAKVGWSISPKRKEQSKHRRRERVLPGPVLGDSGSAGVEVLSASRDSERQNLRVPSGRVRSTGPVSREDKGHIRPDGTSSCQSIAQLRNRLIQPNRHAWRFLDIRRNQHG